MLLHMKSASQGRAFLASAIYLLLVKRRNML